MYVFGDVQLAYVPNDVGVCSRHLDEAASPPSDHVNVASVAVVDAGGVPVIATLGSASADGANTPTSTAAIAATNVSRPPDTERVSSDVLRE